MNWAIQLDGRDSIIVMPYYPEFDPWALKRIKFVERGKPNFDIVKPDDSVWGIA